MRAYTSAGPGPYSDPVTERTLEDGRIVGNLFSEDTECFSLFIASVPASPPLDVMASNITSTTITLTWTEVPAIHQNGVILGYGVEYTQTTFDSVPTTQNVTVTSTLAVLTGLEEYVEYSIQVRAYTEEGPGPYSDVLIVTTSEDSKLIRNDVSLMLYISPPMQYHMQLLSIL